MVVVPSRACNSGTKGSRFAEFQAEGTTGIIGCVRKRKIAMHNHNDSTRSKEAVEVNEGQGRVEAEAVARPFEEFSTFIGDGPLSPGPWTIHINFKRRCRV